MTTILVVEDDLGLAELIREELAQRGWASVHCASGREALAWLAGQRPTLALLDYSLPDMTGAQLLAQAPVEHFIVTTGVGDERVAVAMMKLGAMDYLVKDAAFLDSLGETVALALRHIGTEQRLAEAQASLRQAEADLVRARKVESLGLMAGGIAHDFNNLFQALHSNLELALFKAPEAVQGPLERAVAILERAETLTRRMLDYAGRSSQTLEPLDLNPLVQACLDALGGLPATFIPQPGLPPVRGDAKQLAQVVTGLLENARESLGARGRIRVGTGLGQAGPEGARGHWVHPPPAGDTVWLTVADDGWGMGPDVLERAFDPFFTTRRLGRGLGLAAALGILRAHGAGLWVETAPGRGTTFRIHFPT